MDFFFWGYVKPIAYSSPILDIKALNTRIQGVVLTSSGELFANTSVEIEYRLDILQATIGAHVEISV